MSARDDVLARIRTAIGRPAAPVAVPRAYDTADRYPPGSPDAVHLFVDRLEDYKATVHRTTPERVAHTLEAVLGKDSSVVVPPGLPASWRAACSATGRVVDVDGDPEPLDSLALDAIDAVVTACRVAIAETGTIVLDAAPDQGRRALSLVPDHHVVMVFVSQIVAGVPQALVRLEPTRPLTFISGPSATSDIEFQRVEGVHGPRKLDVVVIDDTMLDDTVLDNTMLTDAVLTDAVLTDDAPSTDAVAPS